MTPAVLSVEHEARCRFGAVLRRYREKRNLSPRMLAEATAYSVSRLVHVENGSQSPSEGVAQRCDQALVTGGSIMQAYHLYRRTVGEAKPASRSAAKLAARSERSDAASALGPVLGSSLVVLEEIATMVHRPADFEVHIVRQLFNNSPQVHTRWLMRMAVERPPQGPQAGLEAVVPDAYCHFRDATGRHTERLTLTLKKDNPTEKEFWLQFRNERSRFPLYPGAEATIDYRFRVSHECWGWWFQRAIRRPTGRLVIKLDFPDSLPLGICGIVESTEGSHDFPTPINCTFADGRQHHSWAIQHPPVEARYRVMWRQ